MYIYVCMHLHMCIHRYSYIYICICIDTDISRYLLRSTYTCMYIHLDTCTYIHLLVDTLRLVATLDRLTSCQTDPLRLVRRPLQVTLLGGYPHDVGERVQLRLECLCVYMCQKVTIQTGEREYVWLSWSRECNVLTWCCECDCAKTVSAC